MAEPLGAGESGLAELFVQGDPEAVAVVDGWVDAILRGSFRSLRWQWDDLRQEVRTRVFRNLSRGDFNRRSSLRTYVHSIAAHTCIDFSRRANRERLSNDKLNGIAPGSSGPTSPDPAAWIARNLLERMLEGMNSSDRLLLRLVFVERYRYTEVAALLGIPEGTVKSRVARCKDRLLRRRDELAEGGRKQA